jgi:hypothetical protein
MIEECEQDRKSNDNKTAKKIVCWAGEYVGKVGSSHSSMRIFTISLKTDGRTEMSYKKVESVNKGPTGL